MQLSNKAPLTVILAASAIFGAANYVAYRSQVNFVDEFKSQELAAIASELSTGLKGFERGAATYGELVATLPSVRAAFKARDREALARELVPSFKNARQKYNASQGSFQTPDLKTFLRLMRPEIFGDDVSHREMMVRANRDRKVQAGLETSISRVSVRAVVPVSDGKEHLGSFEWGFELTRLLQRVQERHDADVALFVDESTFTAPITSAGVTAKATAAKAAEADRMVEGFRTVECSDVDLLRAVTTRDLVAPVGTGAIILTRKVDGIDHGVISVPISDFGGRRLGAICVAKSMAEPQRRIRATRVAFIAATIVGLVLLAGAVQLVFNGLVVRPLLEIGEYLDAMAGGNVGIKIDMKKRTDEIGHMAKNVDKLRDRLAKEKEAAERELKVSERISKLEAKGGNT